MTGRRVDFGSGLPRLERVATIERAEGEGLPRSTLSTADPVSRFGFDEVLEHTPDAIDFERAANGLPLLVNHGAGPFPIGRVENIRLEGDALRGDLSVSEASELGREAAALIADGTVRDLSIGARIDRMTVEERDDGPDVLRITRWTPMEASLASVAADARAGIGRTQEPGTMPSVNTPAASAAAPLRAVDDGQTPEQIRRGEIDEQLEAFVEGFPSLADDARALRARAWQRRDLTPEAFGAELLELADRDEPLARRGGSSLELVADGRDKLALGIERAVLVRCDHHSRVPNDEGAVNEFAAMPAYELCRQWLEANGVDTRGYTRTKLVESVMIERSLQDPAANTTATFPDILANIASNSVQAGFDEHEATWAVWTQTRSAPDFKEFAIAGLSAFDDLPVVAENGEFLEGNYVDKAERGTLAKYGRRFSITWEALINDSLDAFAEIAPGMGRAAARTIDKLPYALLVSNPAMREDTNPLFSNTPPRAAPNDNLLANPMSETGIDNTRLAMLRMVDQNDVEIHPRLRYLIIPSELEITTEKILNDTMIPVSVGSGATREHNTVAGRYTAVSTPWLTDANDWYGAAERNTVQMRFLDGQTNPTTERATGFKRDSVWFKVRHVCVAVASDYRGLVKNVNA